MNLKDLIDSLDKNQFLQAFENVSRQEHSDFGDSQKVILSCIYSNKDLYPKRIKGDSRSQVVSSWLKKYSEGYEKRISRRVSKPVGTVPDPAIEEIINARITKLNSNDLVKIKYAHRLSMSAENILGLFLEEYLATNLLEFGWHCAWGEVVSSVDFCHKDGVLLQIKNRSNSENSSSMRVREGTEIKKWHRVNANNGSYCWDKLNGIIGNNKLSEGDFINFIKNIMTQNPEALSIEHGNPWNE
jgi:hypothetical protein